MPAPWSTTTPKPESHGRAAGRRRPPRRRRRRRSASRSRWRSRCRHGSAGSTCRRRCRAARGANVVGPHSCVTQNDALRPAEAVGGGAPGAPAPPAARRAASSAARRFASAIAASCAAACCWSWAASSAAAWAARSLSAIFCSTSPCASRAALSAASCSACFCSAAARSSASSRLEGGELVAPRLERGLLVARDGARIGEGAAAVLERLAAQLELRPDGADLLGQQGVLLGDGDQVADLRGRLVERVGREEDLEQRGLACARRRIAGGPAAAPRDRRGPRFDG